MTRERNIILFFYVLTLLGALACAIPSMMAQNIGLVGLSVLLVVLYLVRGAGNTDSLTDNHTSFLITSLWVFGLLSVIGTAAAGILVTNDADPSALLPMMGMMRGETPVDEAALMAALETYLHDNHDIMLKSLRVCLFPAELYLIYRATRGLVRAVKLYRIARPRLWF